MSALELGQAIPAADIHLDRGSLVRYAGASGDFNPIHYRDDIAAAVGLPGVLAHGMLTMGLAVQAVVDWIGDPGRIVDYQSRFTRPVIVEPESGADVHIEGKIAAIDDATARVDLTVTVDGTTVLGKAQVTVRLA